MAPARWELSEISVRPAHPFIAALSQEDREPPRTAYNTSPGILLVFLRSRLKKLSSADPFEREGAARTLGAAKDACAVDALIDALSDKEASVRRAACDALGEIGDIRALEPILRLHLSGLLLDAKHALENFAIGTPACIEPLLGTLCGGVTTSGVHWGSPAVSGFPSLLPSRIAVTGRQ
jgi:HEAT repeat protein